MAEDAPIISVDVDGDDEDETFDVVLGDDGTYQIEITWSGAPDTPLVLPTGVTLIEEWVPVLAHVDDMDADGIVDLVFLVGDDIYGFVSSLDSITLADAILECATLEVCDLPVLWSGVGVSHFQNRGAGAEVPVTITTGGGEIHLIPESGELVQHVAPRGLDFNGDGLEDVAISAPGIDDFPSDGDLRGEPFIRECCNTDGDCVECEGACCNPDGTCGDPCGGCCDADGSCLGVQQQSDGVCGAWASPGADCRACSAADGCVDGDCFRRGAVFVFLGGYNGVGKREHPSAGRGNTGSIASFSFQAKRCRQMTGCRRSPAG